MVHPQLAEANIQISPGSAEKGGHLWRQIDICSYHLSDCLISLLVSISDISISIGNQHMADMAMEHPPCLLEAGWSARVRAARVEVGSRTEGRKHRHCESSLSCELWKWMMISGVDVDFSHHVGVEPPYPKKISQLENPTTTGLKIEGIQNHQIGFVRFGSNTSVKFLNWGKCQNFHMTFPTCSIIVNFQIHHTLHSIDRFEGMHIYIYIYIHTHIHNYI